MEKLFGLHMNYIAGCLGSGLGLVLAALAVVAWRGQVMLKLGLRPIGRRRAQSALIVLGLMLATLIITAAFVTGDTLSHTIRSLTLDELGEIDEVVRAGGRSQIFGGTAATPTYFKLSRYHQLAASLEHDSSVDRIVPAIRESIPVVNTTSRKSHRQLEILAVSSAQEVGSLGLGEMVGAGGRPLRLADLGPHEVFLNAEAAEELGAAPGDHLDLYAGPRPTAVVVRAIAHSGKSPRLVMPLKRAQALFGQRGKINVIFVSNAGDASAGADLGPQVTSRLRTLLTDPAVARELFGMLAGDATAVRALRDAAARRRGNTQQDLLALADGLAAGQLTPATLSLLADEGLATQAQHALADAGWRSEAARERLDTLFADLSELDVDDVKRDNLDQGELAASAFTTIFVVTGLFSIAAGLLLIFLIFVMLAAERKSEMGMTRAIGAQRRHLVEMFVFEGTAYDLAAAAVGVALGVLTGLVIAATLGQAFSAGTGLEIRPSVTVRSLVVSYALGMLVTFATVVFSAYRVSKLNIVAAIRDLPEPVPPPAGLGERLLAPFRVLGEGPRRFRLRRVVRILWTWLLGIPRGLLRLVWAGFASGPLTLFLGVAMVPAGLRDSSGAVYALGVSLALIGGGLVLRAALAWPLRRRPDRRDRIAFTAMGMALTIFWVLPTETFESLGVKDLQVGAEMLFISGILLVAGPILVIMHNADVMLQFILWISGGGRRLAPVLRMAIAYPLSNRFRTGLTVGMFAVVVFSVVFMATSFKTNESFFANTDALTGGFDLRAESSSANPLEDLAGQIASAPLLRRGDYEAIAAQSALSAELRQGDGQWEGYVVRGVDSAYAEHIGYDLAVMAPGYESAADVWRAVRDRPGYAVIDSYPVPSRQTTNIVIGGPEFRLRGVYIEDDTMPPLALEVREPRTRARFQVTVIGIIERGAFLNIGLYTSQATLDRALPFELQPTTYFIRLADGARPEHVGPALESAFLKHGLQSIDQVEEIRQQQATQRVVEILLQGFLTLGLIVGVAALGVISTRAVVERRQQIGMLRALGFQREMVAWSFLIESSFVALLGIGLGTGLALIPAYQLITETAKEVPGIEFHIPWESIALVAALAYGMALLTTWLPAAQASRVAPAEALRYE